MVDLLTGMGYGGSRANAGRRIGKTADGGIDGVINEDHLGLDIVYLQAKRYAPGNTVGVDKVLPIHIYEATTGKPVAIILAPARRRAAPRSPSSCATSSKPSAPTGRAWRSWCAVTATTPGTRR